MELEQAIKYLKNVLGKWQAFCKGHGQFARALQTVLKSLEENEIKKG